MSESVGNNPSCVFPEKTNDSTGRIKGFPQYSPSSLSKDVELDINKSFEEQVWVTQAAPVLNRRSSSAGIVSTLQMQTSHRKEFRRHSTGIACMDQSRELNGIYREKTSIKKQSRSFPAKLHQMLSECSNENGSVLWKPHGRAFYINNEAAFVQNMLPKYFKQTKITSFYRQLSRYAFCRLKQGIDNGAFFHPLFLRGMPFLCEGITRIKIGGGSNMLNTTFPPDCELNFYGMPPVENIAASFESWCCRDNRSEDSKLNSSFTTNEETTCFNGNESTTNPQELCNSSKEDTIPSISTQEYSIGQDDIYMSDEDIELLMNLH